METRLKKHIKTLIICSAIYLIGFFVLERFHLFELTYMETWLDNYIPFNEYFVIPYVIWYFYIILGFIYFLFQDDFQYHRCMYYLFAGMFIALFIYTFFPNGQNLRVELTNDNIFQSMVSFLYTIDTPTNVCPSLHTYNSIMMYVALKRSHFFKNRRVLDILTFILVVSICASTVLIKQHAIVDVFGGILMSIIVYYVGKYKFGY